MSVGIIQFACPTCRKLQSAPSTAAGQSMRCPYCHQVFMIPVVASQPVAFTPSPVVAPQATVMPPLARPTRPQAPPTPPISFTTATPSQVSGSVPSPMGVSKQNDDSDPPRSRLTPWLGMVFMCVAGLAMLVGTIAGIQFAQGKLKLPKWEVVDAESGKPPAGRSLAPKETEATPQEVVEGNEVPAQEMPVRDARALSPYEQNLQKIEAAERERIANRNNGISAASGPRTVQLDPKIVARIKWEDARDVTVQMNRVKVKVERIEIGNVMGRDAANTVVPVDRNRYLSVFLQLQNVGDFPLEYHTWYREGGSAKSRHKPATVQDNLGRSYPVRTFQGFKRLRGVSSTEKLVPHEEVQDVVVFEPPAGSMDEVKYFMLSLPASAYGGEGTYRFEVPIEMTKGW